MSKIIVTHLNPDLDAITAIWLIKRFFPDWQEAGMSFVPAGKTFRGAPPDEDSEIIHVDTGLGEFDHHQTKKNTSSAQLVLKKIFQRYRLSKEKSEALKRLVAVVTEQDQGQDISWPEAGNDRYEFMFFNFISNFGFAEYKNQEKVNFTLPLMDAIFQTIKNKIEAEKEIKKGKKFKTRWGKAVAVETGLDDVLSVGEKMGYVLVVKRNPKDGHLRIYGRHDKKINLTKAFKKFKKKDSVASWYLHPSKCLLLNGSRTDPAMVPTKLDLNQVMEILRKA